MNENSHFNQINFLLFYFCHLRNHYLLKKAILCNYFKIYFTFFCCFIFVAFFFLFQFLSFFSQNKMAIIIIFLHILQIQSSLGILFRGEANSTIIQGSTNARLIYRLILSWSVELTGLVWKMNSAHFIHLRINQIMKYF